MGNGASVKDNAGAPADLRKLLSNLVPKWQETFDILPTGYRVLANQAITDETIEEFLSDISSGFGKGSRIFMPKLDVEFINCPNVTSKGIRLLLTHIKTRFDGLYQLYLNFRGCSVVTDKELKEISAIILAQADHQLSLSLNLGGSEITDQGLNEFSASVAPQLLTLQDLSLSFYRCKNITDNGLSMLSTNFAKSLVSLNSLQLNFKDCKSITDKGLKGLSTNLGTAFSGLQRLSLDFDDCNKITDKGLKDLSTNIASLTSLKRLDLNFHVITNITDQGVKDLSTNIASSFTELQHLQLEFSCCEEISDEGAKAVFKNIGSRLHNLRHLHLDFERNVNNCEKLTNGVLKYFSTDVAPSLTGLEYLLINFSGCKAVQGKDEVAKQLRNKLKNLQYIHIRETKITAPCKH